MRGFRSLGSAARARTARPVGAIEGAYDGIRCRASYAHRRITTTTPRSDPEPTPITERFRSLMRLLPHPVVVCTAVHPGPTPQPRAMTMSSVTSLSLNPAPLLSFNIKKPSRTLDALEASGRFNIHVLSGDSEGARVAEWFSRGDAGRDPFEGVEGCGCVVASGEGKGEGVELRGEGVRRVVRCRVEEMVGVRDHVIVVGEVEGIDGEREGLGLAYADRGYRNIGGVMQKHSEGK